MDKSGTLLSQIKALPVKWGFQYTKLVMKKSNWFSRFFGWSTSVTAVVMILGIALAYYYMGNHLPDVTHLKETPLQVPLRVYSADGKLIAEYGNLRRNPVPLSKVPQDLINAVLATEDHRFYDHSGVDPIGLMRAAVELMRNRSISQGGSTITMQVARNFYLSRHKTFRRKLKEILLAIKIDRHLSKERILELYLNKIYFGHRAYGVATAAMVYYGKPLTQLTLAQMAMIAGLPKAPSTLNPITNPAGALQRRNHVLTRMREYDFINEQQYQQAIAAPITAEYHGQKVEVEAPYVAEMARSALVAWVGKEAAYNGGYQITTTINSRLQKIANRTLNNGLLAYEERHGYRGALKNLGATAAPIAYWLKALKGIPRIQHLHPAIAAAVNKHSADVLLGSGQLITMEEDSFSWAMPQAIRRHHQYPKTNLNDLLHAGDVIYIRQLANHSWQLAQVPAVEGALVSLDPHNGAVQALVGGFDYQHSKFNRALQARRQSGSAFKPFIYAAALAKNFTLASTINDAPVVVNDPSTADLWRPQNNNRRFYGPTRLRLGLVKSRNLVSIRLLNTIGVNYTVYFSQRFGFKEKDLPASLSLALGTGLTTPLQIARGYSVFANGGYLITPHFIKTINNARGDVVFQAKAPVAGDWKPVTDPINSTSSNTQQSNEAPQTLTPQIAYLITNTLQDVVNYGTARRALVLKRHDIAGKTGSTNEQKDAWFVGYNRDLVTVTWMGYDQPQSLHEYGAQAALPIWIDFMGTALRQKPDLPWPQPTGLVTLRIDPRSGYATHAKQTNSIFEIFRRENAPNITQANYDTDEEAVDDDENDATVYEHLF